MCEGHLQMTTHLTVDRLSGVQACYAPEMSENIVLNH